ncbi:unnamed protein product [Meganyctiphanes norvegica]|uniref:CUB domain-containing protein n=1 Tax=Meganyctiphanes norvegica TaxID=48144 RepID=A0AAV2S8K5_MEGNR
MPPEVLLMISVQLVVTWVSRGRADILYAENTHLTFDAWLADTKPGFTVNERNLNGRTCYCRAPLTSTTFFPGNYSSSTTRGTTTTTQTPSSSSIPSWFISHSLHPSIPASASIPCWFISHSHDSTWSSFDLVQMSYGTSSHAGTTNTFPTGTTITVSAGQTSYAVSTNVHSSFNSFDQLSVESLGLGQISGIAVPSSSFEMVFMVPHSSVNNADTTNTNTPGETLDGNQPYTLPITMTTGSPGKTLDANKQESLPTTMSTSTSKITVQPTTDSICGSCNATFIIGEDWREHTVTWSSPGWEQGTNYPDGCVCTLTVKLQVMMGSVNFRFANGSNIFALDNCSYDRLEVQIDEIHDVWCDYGMADKSEVMMTFDGTPKTATFLFVSDPFDGRTTERGFQLIMEPTLFG